MTVKELIEDLKDMPFDSEVGFVFDDNLYIPDLTWLSKGKQVILGNHSQVIYNDEYRPQWAPDSEEKEYWETPEEEIDYSHPKYDI